MNAPPQRNRRILVLSIAAVVLSVALIAFGLRGLNRSSLGVQAWPGSAGSTATQAVVLPRTSSGAHTAYVAQTRVHGHAHGSRIAVVGHRAVAPSTEIVHFVAPARPGAAGNVTPRAITPRVRRRHHRGSKVTVIPGGSSSAPLGHAKAPLPKVAPVPDAPSSPADDTGYRGTTPTTPTAPAGSGASTSSAGANAPATTTTTTAPPAPTPPVTSSTPAPLPPTAAAPPLNEGWGSGGHSAPGTASPVTPGANATGTDSDGAVDGAETGATTPDPAPATTVSVPTG
jgi:hypothetical protein